MTCEVIYIIAYCSADEPNAYCKSGKFRINEIGPSWLIREFMHLRVGEIYPRLGKLCKFSELINFKFTLIY